MLELFKVDSAICPYGVDINLFRPIDGVEKSDYVVSVGEMTPRKGFDFIVEGLGRIPESDRPRLRVASNYVDKGELDYVMRLAEKAGVDLKVFVDQNTEQLRLLYNQARLCVYTPVQEPFGLVPLESMACGTPVIGVKEGGVQESVLHEQTGLLVERDQELFSEAIQKLLSDRRLADSYGRKGRKHVLDNWTWEKSVSNLTAYFERLC